MTARFDFVTIDCHDPRRLADFWAAALGYRPTKVSDGWVSLEDPAGRTPGLGFQKVPEPKTGKVRIHLDVRAPGGDVESEVRRLEGLGARHVERVVNDNGGHVIMRDPEQHEFCVV